MTLVRYAPAALRDLEQVGDFIGRDNPGRARTFVAELRAACRSLGDTSLRYPLMPGSKDMRRMPVGNYLVFYKVSAGTIDILRVLHSARDIEDFSG